MLTRALFNAQALKFGRRLTQTTPITFKYAQRSFAEVAVQQPAATQVESVESINARLGVDAKFDQQKHAYVLTFPWNFPEIVNTFETKHRTL